MALFGLIASALFNHGPVPETIDEQDFSSFESTGLFAFIGVWFFIEIVRTIWEIKWIYQRVNNYGTKFGFAKEYLKWK